MQAGPIIDLSELIDRRGIGAFHISLFALTILIVLADGYDVVSIAFVAPVLLREWHFNPQALGLLFGSGFLGGLFGPALFGYLSDRLGRKYTSIFGTAFFGAFTLAQVWCVNLDQMIWLRLLAGIGMSGIIPTIVALNAEYAPRRLQSTIAIVSFIGIAIGGLVAGLVAVTLLPTYGWQIVFWIGGVGPIIAAFIGLFVFPESIKFLSLKPKRRAEMMRIIARMAPGSGIAPDSDFVIGGEINRPKVRLADLFDGTLKWITPLLWLTNVLTLIVFFFVNQWMPTILSSAGYTLEQAQWGTLVLQIGNVIGAFLLMKPLARWGYFVVALACGLSIPFLVLLGMPELGLPLVLGAVFFAGIGISWLQFGNIATESQVYSTYTRSLGIGLCFTFLRLGSLIGPVAGGVLVGMKLPWAELFLLVAAVQGLNFLCTVALAPLYRKRMAELRAGGEIIGGMAAGH